MSVENTNTPTSKTSDKGALTAGVMLIVIGLGLLAFRWLSLDAFFPLALGLGFITAGIITRQAGLIIPGGIIGGAGLGIVAMENNLFAQTGSPAGGGVFLVAMSLGWFLIIPLSKLFTDETQIWPIFPAGAMLLIGSLVMMGESGLRILEVLGNYWPLILVAIGAYLLIQFARQAKRQQ